MGRSRSPLLLHVVVVVLHLRPRQLVAIALLGRASSPRRTARVGMRAAKRGKFTVGGPVRSASRRWLVGADCSSTRLPRCQRSSIFLVIYFSGRFCTSFLFLLASPRLAALPGDRAHFRGRARTDSSGQQLKLTASQENERSLTCPSARRPRRLWALLLLPAPPHACCTHSRWAQARPRRPRPRLSARKRCFMHRPPLLTGPPRRRRPMTRVVRADSQKEEKGKSSRRDKRGLKR